MAAFIFPSTDAHQSEYVAPHWQGREWISGFNGSAGIAVVTLTKAALWTDSRYFLAAEQQLKGTEYQLMKQRVEGTPTIAQWLGEQLAEVDSPEVGLDGMVNSYHETQALVAELRQKGGITVRTNFDPLDIIWKDRPSIPDFLLRFNLWNMQVRLCSLSSRVFVRLFVCCMPMVCSCRLSMI